MSKKKNRDYRTEIYFVRGKMKKRKIPLIEGMEVEEFMRRNADDITLLQEGYFEILHEREMARDAAGDFVLDKNADEKVARREDLEEDLPF